MPSWPTDTVNIANLDNGATDTPSLARADLLNLATIVKQMLTAQPLQINGNKLNLTSQADPGWGGAIAVIHMSGGGAVFAGDAIGMGSYGTISAIGFVSGAYYDGTTWRYSAAGNPATIQAIGGTKSIVMTGFAPVSAYVGDPVTWTFRADNAARGASYYQDTSGPAALYPGAGVTLSGSNYQKLAFQGQSYDPNSMMNTARDRFTIPSGVSWVRLLFSVQAETTADSGNGPAMMMTKNRLTSALAPLQDGAMFQDGIVGGFFGRSSGPYAYLLHPNGNGASAPIQVVQGDYFELFARPADLLAGTVKLMDEGTWFAMEVLQ